MIEESWDGIMSEQYSRVLGSVDFFRSNGYTEVYLPWAVDAEFTNATLPDPSMNISYMGKELVGSAEQAFIEKFSNKTEEYEGYTTFVALGPCFRQEPYPTRLNRPYFFKAELFGLDLIDLHDMIDLAHTHFSKYIKCDVIPTDQGHDIIARHSEIELGSYGIRTHKELTWIYGTACAEPRLTEAILRTR